MVDEVHEGPRTLSIDIGGSGIKMLILDPRGEPITERTRIETPRPGTPEAVLAVIIEMVGQQPEFDRISIGFPGVVQDGVTRTAHNLDDSWRGVDLRGEITRLTGKPARVCNDADIQGLGVIDGSGIELVLTLGTGLGSSLFLEGRLVPNLELAHHPFSKGRSYEDQVANRTLEKVGKARWRKRVRKVVDRLDRTFAYRVLHFGGGNAKLLRAEDLPANVKIQSNRAGLTGGIALWR